MKSPRSAAFRSVASRRCGTSRPRPCRSESRLRRSGTPTGRPSCALPPPIVCYVNHGPQAGLELLVARAIEAPLQLRHDLGARPSSDKDDEPEAQPILVGGVEPVEL